MASTCSFVGTTAVLRAAPGGARRGGRAAARAPVNVTTRSDGAVADCVVTPATVATRSGSASVKGTSRTQNEDRFSSYVRRARAAITHLLPDLSSTSAAPSLRHLSRRNEIAQSASMDKMLRAHPDITVGAPLCIARVVALSYTSCHLSHLW